MKKILLPLWICIIGWGSCSENNGGRHTEGPPDLPREYEHHLSACNTGELLLFPIGVPSTLEIAVDSKWVTYNVQSEHIVLYVDPNSSLEPRQEVIAVKATYDTNIAAHKHREYLITVSQTPFLSWRDLEGEWTIEYDLWTKFSVETDSYTTNVTLIGDGQIEFPVRISNTQLTTVLRMNIDPPSDQVSHPIILHTEEFDPQLNQDTDYIVRMAYIDHEDNQIDHTTTITPFFGSTTYEDDRFIITGLEGRSSGPKPVNAFAFYYPGIGDNGSSAVGRGEYVTNIRMIKYL